MVTFKKSLIQKNESDFLSQNGAFAVLIFNFKTFCQIANSSEQNNGFRIKAKRRIGSYFHAGLPVTV